MAQDDWKPGDLALCVNDGKIICAHGHIHTGNRSCRRGQTKTVVGFGLNSNGSITCPEVSLIFAGGEEGLARRFRKISPLTEEERQQALRDLTAPEKVML